MDFGVEIFCSKVNEDEKIGFEFYFLIYISHI
jgi:hypothetical protein